MVGRFIQHQHITVGQTDDSELQAGTLSAGKLPHQPVGVLPGKSHGTQGCTQRCFI